MMLVPVGTNQNVCSLGASDLTPTARLAGAHLVSQPLWACGNVPDNV